MLLLGLLAGALAAPITVAERLAEVEQLRGLLLSSQGWRPPSSAIQTALAGQLAGGVEGEVGPRRVWGVIVLAAPVDLLWAALNDDRSKVRWTSLDHLSLVHGEWCESPRKTFQYAGLGVLTDRWWVLDQRGNPALMRESEGRVRELVWRSVDDPLPLLDEESRRWADGGVQVPVTEGAWLLMDLGDGRTLVQYNSRTDPGGWLPDGLSAAVGVKTLQGNFNDILAIAKAGPTCPVR